MKKTLLGILGAVSIGSSLVANANAQSAQKSFEAARNAQGASIVIPGWYGDLMGAASRDYQIQGQQQAHKEAMDAINRQNQTQQEYVPFGIQKLKIYVGKDDNKDGSIDSNELYIRPSGIFTVNDELVMRMIDNIPGQKYWRFTVFDEKGNKVREDAGSHPSTATNNIYMPSTKKAMRFGPGKYTLIGKLWDDYNHGGEIRGTFNVEMPVRKAMPVNK